MFSNKLARSVTVAVIALALVFGSVGMTPSVQAQTQSMAQLQAQINQLLATITQLQAQLAARSGTAPAACPYTWTRDLSVGSTGQDVMRLQQFLNGSADTRLALSGAGSPGAETQYYGPITAAAVSKFQAKHRAQVLTPLGLVSPTGYFGPSSRAAANDLCVTPTTPPVTPPQDDDEDEDEDDEDVDLRGEGTLRSFEIDDASDTTIKEGQNDAPIAELTLEARNGDIEITRMDIALVGVNSPTENDPWDVFTEVSLWVDGELIARIDADNKRDYLDDDDGTLRFSRLGIVLEEDEEIEMTIAASIANNVDGAGSDADWSVAVESIRYFDADGVATDDTRTGDIGDAADFEIVEKGEGEALKFRLSSNNPDATDIVVDEDRRTNNETIMAYEITAEGGDIELDTLFVTIVTSATTTNVLDDIKISVDGDEFRDDSVTVNSPFSRTYRFDIDGNVTIDEDETAEVEVIVNLKAQKGKYDNGTTIRAQVTSSERDMTEAEGADDVDEFSGTAVGDDHTLVAVGTMVGSRAFSSSFERQGSNDTTGVFALKFSVTAVEDDFYITDDTSRDPASANTGVAYRLDAPSTFVAGSSTINAILTSSAKEDTNGVFTVREGTTETFTLQVVIDPNVSGYYRVALAEINYDDDSSGAASPARYVPLPETTFRSGYHFINN